ncbi:MAG: glycosyltransferase [bacterium]|nr:glycosyltransferase [bacterium]
MSGPRVMRILTRPNVGGPTRQAIALWHEHRELAVPTLLVTGRVDHTEDVLSPADHGVPRLTLAEAIGLGERATGWVEVPELVRGIAPFGDLAAGRQLARLLRSLRPDVVHTHTSKAGAVGRRAAHAARRSHAMALVHTFHGHVLRDYFGRALSELLRRGERRRARTTDRLLAVSPSCADELAALGVASRDRFAVVPPAVPLAPPTTRQAARRELALDEQPFRAVAVGRLVRIKRHEDFVAAVASVDGVFGDVVGEGPERARLLAAAREIRGDGDGDGTVGPRVTLRGGVPHIARLLPAWDALVLASRREGCPLVAVEAFAAGVPVVGYDVPGVRDVLTGWGGGLLVPERAGPAGLAAALERLRHSPDLRAECAAAGRAALDRFRPAAVARELLELYRAAL